MGFEQQITNFKGKGVVVWCKNDDMSWSGLLTEVGTDYIVLQDDMLHPNGVFVRKDAIMSIAQVHTEDIE